MRKFLVLVLLLAACSKHERAAPVAREKPTAAAPAAAAAPVAATAFSDIVNDAKGAPVVTIRGQAGGEIEIEFKDHRLHGSQRDSGKRKYTQDGNPATLEVKPGDNGFKVRSIDGVLHWKVKIDGDKVKISDNEENKNPFELKMKEPGRVKVVGPGERDLGNVRGKDVEDAGGAVQFRAATGGGTPAYGVLLLKDIPPNEQYVIMAELLARQR